MTSRTSSIRSGSRRVRFFAGKVESIDLERRTVRACHGDDGHPHEIEYDHLVLAPGSVTNFFGLPGLEEKAMTMKSLGDAIALRNRMIANLEEADFECCAGERRRLLTVVVAGGGFAGVETAASLGDFLQEALPFYAHLEPRQVRVVLVHSGDVILPELGTKLGRYAERKLRERGVEVRTGVRVQSFEDDRVHLSDGTEIESRTLVWTAGTSPSPLLSGLPCAKDRGRIAVDECLPPDLEPPLDLVRLSDAFLDDAEGLREHGHVRERRGDLHQVLGLVDVVLGEETVEEVDPALHVRVVGRHVRLADPVVEARPRTAHGGDDVVARPEPDGILPDSDDAAEALVDEEVVAGRGSRRGRALPAGPGTP